MDQSHIKDRGDAQSRNGQSRWGNEREGGLILCKHRDCFILAICH